MASFKNSAQTAYALVNHLVANSEKDLRGQRPGKERDYEEKHLDKRVSGNLAEVSPAKSAGNSPDLNFQNDYSVRIKTLGGKSERVKGASAFIRPFHHENPPVYRDILSHRKIEPSERGKDLSLEDIFVGYGYDNPSITNPVKRRQAPSGLVGNNYLIVYVNESLTWGQLRDYLTGGSPSIDTSRLAPLYSLVDELLLESFDYLVETGFERNYGDVLDDIEAERAGNTEKWPENTELPEEEPEPELDMVSEPAEEYDEVLELEDEDILEDKVIGKLFKESVANLPEFMSDFSELFGGRMAVRASIRYSANGMGLENCFSKESLDDIFSGLEDVLVSISD